jgi:hypothetical protein
MMSREANIEELEAQVATLTAHNVALATRNEYLQRVHDDAIATLASVMNSLKATS